MNRRERIALVVALAVLVACTRAGGDEPEPDQAAFCEHLTAAAGLGSAFDSAFTT